MKGGKYGTRRSKRVISELLVDDALHSNSACVYNRPVSCCGQSVSLTSFLKAPENQSRSTKVRDGR